jgi:hypothetical protein
VFGFERSQPRRKMLIRCSVESTGEFLSEKGRSLGEDKAIPSGLSATLTLPDYGRFARHSGVSPHACGKVTLPKGEGRPPP